jgi:hypothetical protein
MFTYSVKDCSGTITITQFIGAIPVREVVLTGDSAANFRQDIGPRQDIGRYQEATPFAGNYLDSYF